MNFIKKMKKEIFLKSFFIDLIQDLQGENVQKKEANIRERRSRMEQSIFSNFLISRTYVRNEVRKKNKTLQSVFSHVI